MAVEIRGERGQSVLEFLILVPLMVGLIILLVRVNSAIQVAIVDQQYARAQTLFLTMNSNTYPRLALRVGQLDKKDYNQMILGVSDTAPPPGDSGAGSFPPDATVQDIGGKKVRGSDEPQAEPEQRSLVRVRNTVALCTQNNVVRDQSGAFKPIIDLSGKDNAPQGPAVLTETTQFAYCHAREGIYE